MRTPPPNDASAPDASRKLPANLQRRRLLHRGLGASAPVLLTLASGPVSAANCIVASSFVSVATFNSRNPVASTVGCLAKGIEYWAALPQSDPDRKFLEKATFADLFGTSTLAGSTVTTTAYVFQASVQGATGRPPTAWELLTRPVAMSGDLAVVQLMIAAYMNATKGWLGPQITVPYLQGVWQNYTSTGGYRLAASGINWTEAELITWLRVLMYPMPG